ncbi:MAG: TIGR03086 family protein [Dehalococcoidia bacterium]|nr:TIGR03086 family protein [Dehalococcoidia bacterium]
MPNRRGTIAHAAGLTWRHDTKCRRSTISKAKDPIELYEAATKNTRKIFAKVKPSQMTASTTCKEWDVQKLMEHISGGMGMAAAAFSGRTFDAADHDKAKGGTSVEAYDAAMKQAVEGLRALKSLDATVKVPFGERPAKDLAVTLFMDNLLHGWGLAQATGQDAKLPKDLVEAC